MRGGGRAGVGGGADGGVICQHCRQEEGIGMKEATGLRTEEGEQHRSCKNPRSKRREKVIISRRARGDAAKPADERRAHA